LPRYPYFNLSYIQPVVYGPLRGTRFSCNEEVIEAYKAMSRMLLGVFRRRTLMVGAHIEPQQTASEYEAAARQAFMAATLVRLTGSFRLAVNH
jgi:hypothetical protein